MVVQGADTAEDEGICGTVVYADDFVMCFQHKDEAVKFHEMLKRRMAHFGLELEESKTRLIEFGRFAEDRGIATTGVSFWQC